jgi:hypothetical protein
LPGTVARREQSHALGFFLNPGPYTSILPDGSPSCALLGRREAAVLAILSAAAPSDTIRSPFGLGSSRL